MSIDVKRIASAWLLLAVFLSATVVSSIHRHELSAEAAVCADCAHHVHHLGHLSEGTLQIDHCLVCQFLGTTYLGASMLVMVSALLCVARRMLHAAVALCCKEVLCRTSRAPPQAL